MLAFYATQKLERRGDQGVLFMQLVGKKVIFPTFAL
jgi:hypothetical protein